MQTSVESCGCSTHTSVRYHIAPALAALALAVLAGCGKPPAPEQERAEREHLQNESTARTARVASVPATGAVPHSADVFSSHAAYNQILDASGTGALDAATLARGASFEFLRRQAWDSSPVEAVVYAEAMLLTARTRTEAMGARLLIAKHSLLLGDYRKAEQVLLEMPDDQSSQLAENLTLQKYSELADMAVLLHGYRTALVYSTRLLALPLHYEQPKTFRASALYQAAQACAMLSDKDGALRYAQEIIDMADPQGVLMPHKMTAQSFCENYDAERASLLEGRAATRRKYEEYKRLYAKYGDKAVDHLLRTISTDDPRAARAALLNKLRFAKDYVPPND